MFAVPGGQVLKVFDVDEMVVLARPVSAFRQLLPDFGPEDNLLEGDAVVDYEERLFGKERDRGLLDFANEVGKP